MTNDTLFCAIRNLRGDLQRVQESIAAFRRLQAASKPGRREATGPKARPRAL